MEQFPGNSHTSKTTPVPEAEPEKVETTDPTPKKRTVNKVVTGKVIQRPKPLGTRFKEFFVSSEEDEESFPEYLARKVIVPMAKDMVLSIITQTADGFRQGIEERLFPGGEGRRRRTTSYGTGRPVVNYSKYSSVVTRRSEDRPPSPDYRRSNRVQEIIVGSREQGEDLIAELEEMIESIGHCTVGDYYEAAGKIPRSTDHRWGWTNLDRATVNRIDEDEYLVYMPRPRPIET